MEEKNMKKNKTGNMAIIAAVAIICIICSAGITYFFVEQMRQPEKNTGINNLTAQYEAEISNLYDIDEDRQTFDKLILKAMEKAHSAWLNGGYARAYYDEAVHHYSLGSYDWGEAYFIYSRDYYSYTGNSFGEAYAIFKQAKDYATNNKILDFTQKYIQYVNLSEQSADLQYDICDNFRLACHYYNINDLDNGMKKVDAANNLIEEWSDLADIFNDALNEIDILFESSWEE